MLVFHKDPFEHKQLRAERIHKLTQVVKELQQEHRNLVGATLYGSLAKGYVDEESDIDLMFHFDNSYYHWPIVHRLQENDLFNISVFEFAEPFRHEVEYALQQRISASLGLPPAFDLRHITCEPISRGIIKQDIRSLVHNIRAVQRYTTAANQEMLVWPKKYSVSPQLVSLFDLQLGSGNLDLYRDFVIQQLERYPDVAKAGWSAIREGAFSFGSYPIPEYQTAKRLYK